MWEMIDSDFDIECGNECFGPGPPPVFRIPPPPRPPFLQEISKCTEEPLADFEMCQAIPILDASYHSSPSLQTSAMILLCSVLLLIFIFVSSILVWKHKRKVQNFLPCKTPTRGPLSNPGVPGGHSVTYEDPDMHLGHHRPLVMRHQLNVEMLHPKTIHYPSGYPMPRSPPLFICSSPGPDPYRSHDNVYEELEHRRYSDSEPQLHSDDDFAEDELSLPGDRSFNKTSPDNTTVATIYQGQGSNSSANETNSTYIERNRVERNSLLSSASSSANDNNVRPNIRNSSSSNESNHTATLNNINTNSNSNNISSSSNGNTGIFRFRTSRPNSCKNQGGSNRNNRQKTNNFSMDNLNTSTETAPATDDVVVVPSTYSNSSSNNSGHNNNSGTSTTTTTDPNCNTLSNSNNINNNPGDNNNNNNINNNNNNSNNITHNGSCSGRNNYQTMDSESDVERRNRINAQLSNPTMSVATICRDRNIRYPTIANSNYYAAPPQQLMVHGSNNNNNNNNNVNNNHQSRTNPRAPPTERRRNFTTNNSSDNVVNNNNNQEYLYQEPVFHEGMIYDPCLSYNNNRNNQHYHPYILPEFTTFRNNCNNLNNPHQPLAIYGNPHGSDSGYSQNTQNSGSRSLWGRRKRNNNTIATTNRNEQTTPYEGS